MLIARSWSASYYPDPERFTEIVSACCAHRPWFSDMLWEDETLKRAAVARYLAEGYTDGKVWEVLQNGELCGIFLLEGISPGIDATVHFIFFDSKLREKRDLCLGGMQWAFYSEDGPQLQVLRLSIPTYAKALAKWARLGLGFRYEAEWADPELTPRKASLVSRLHRTTLYKGNWCDSFRLSITREALSSFLKTLRNDSERTIDNTSERLDSPPSGTDAAD